MTIHRGYVRIPLNVGFRLGCLNNLKMEMVTGYIGYIGAQKDRMQDSFN